MAHNKRTQSGEFLQQALLNDKDFLRVWWKDSVKILWRKR